MGLPASKKIWSEEEYLALERESDERYEYLDGEVFMMAGESPQHADISVNLVGEFRAKLKGSSCRVWTKDMKVRSGPGPTWRPRNRLPQAGMYSHPDIVIVCGEPQFHDQYSDVLLNPRVIVEVLSPSTQAFDRWAKFWRFRQWNTTLTDYILVSQSEVFIDHYIRQADGLWAILASYTELNEILEIPSLNLRISVAEIYDRVFSAEELEG